MACFLLIFLGLNLAHAQDGVFQSFWQQIPESDATFFRTRGLEIDRLGNLYLTAADSNPDIIWQCVRKYDPFGILLWERVETNVTPQRSAIDGEQNLYVMGSVESESTDISLFKYDRKGDMEWHLSYDGPGRGEDVGQDLSIGPDQVVVTGSTTNGDGNLNLLVLA